MPRPSRPRTSRFRGRPRAGGSPSAGRVDAGGAGRGPGAAPSCTSPPPSPLPPPSPPPSPPSIAPGALDLRPLPEPLPPTPEFLSAAAALGIDFEPGDLERLGLYLALLLRTNQTHNLTAITDPATAWRRHLLDALTLVPPLAELEDGSEVIDVGSGGGVPGVPLAIVCPGLRFTLVEPTGKKAAFLAGAIAALGLTNARVLNARAERLGQDRRHHRERYAAGVVRAVGPLSVIAELVLPLVSPGRWMFAIKGQKADEELREAAHALHILGGRHRTTLDTPTGRIVVIAKERPTPRLYPRADGEPRHRPLGGRTPPGAHRARATDEPGST
jgi:16S rRNA (guanine527-N7)-methyltransferase